MKKSKLAWILILSISSLTGLHTVFSYAESEPFPLYPGIAPNVRFWIDVYSVFPTTKGILHDTSDLSIVYGVIDLLPPETAGAEKVNRKRIRLAKDKYRKILSKLSENPASQDTETRDTSALFGPNANRSTYRKAMFNIRCQIGQKDRFEEGVIRSSFYLHEIKEIFRAKGMPEDLAYIPHVESSFNPKAYSKAGAVGIWQFTRSTGRKFMRVSRALDERRDPITSSEAAALLLKDNYDKLGSWPLAITAYNHGIAGLLKAKKRKGSEEAIFSEYSTKRFKFASRNFYAEFLAARHVAKQFERSFDAAGDSPSAGAGDYAQGQSGDSDAPRQGREEIATIPPFDPCFQASVCD